MRRLVHELTRPRGRRGHPWYGAQRARRSKSGLALLMVITTMMFMTVLVTDLNYGARVRLLMAAHQQEEAQAYWLGRTGVNVYKLILVANKELEKNSAFASATAMFGINLGDALWQMVPAINTGLMRMLFGGGGDIDEEDIEAFQAEGVSDEAREASREGGGRFSDRNFLDFDGDFAAEIVDEDSKVSVAALSASVPPGGSFRELPAAQMLYGLMSGEENDQWFYDRGIERWDLIGNLRDWIDVDTTIASGLGGYEDNLYNRLEPPYLTKNAAFDSMEEIRLVEGWQDEAFERFKDQITIYGAGKVNINTASDEVIRGLIRAKVPSLAQGGVALDAVMADLAEYKLLSSFQKPSDFVSWLSQQVSEVTDGLDDLITTSSQVFRITSYGQVGNTTITITAVLDFNESAQGKMVYWRVN